MLVVTSHGVSQITLRPRDDKLEKCVSRTALNAFNLQKQPFINLHLISAEREDLNHPSLHTRDIA